MLSNCSKSYLDKHDEIFRLTNYFDDLVCSELFDGIPKSEILGFILEKYPSDYVIIGDRFHDIDAGVANNIYTIGCSYGYGSVEEYKKADMVINSISELKQYF